MLVVGDLRLVLQLAVLERKNEEDTEEEEEAREVEELEEEGEEDEEGEAEDAEKEDTEEVEEEPKEEEKTEEEEEMEEVEVAEEAEEDEGEEEAEEQAVEEEDEVEEAKEDAAEEDVLQSELERVNKQTSRSYSWLKLRFPMIGEQDEGLLGYMTDLKVEEFRIPCDCCKILLFFHKNPYFWNEVIVKEYVLSAAGYGPSHSTPIQWHQTYEREAYSRRQHNTSPNLFNWFSDHNFAVSSRIAEIILDDGPISCSIM
ncbi:hypothetical protein GH733_019204 [Mirounga leonina]|nr:hypothetical protein GH733_019204 [Mirounga leonina]